MRVALVCVASVLLAGCSLLDEKATNLEVTAQISPVSFRAGDQTMVTITTTNNGTRPQGVSAKSCPLPFVVLDAARKRVGPQGQICTTEAIIKTLAPGETYVQTLPWFGYGFDGPADGPVMLPPGRYSIRSMWGDDQTDNHNATFQIVN